MTATTTRYEYDHLSRPTKLLHAVDGALPTRLATYSYDAVGRLTAKTFGGFDVSGAVTSTQSGSWTQPTTWQNGNLPGNNTLVNINANHSVRLPGSSTTATGNLLIGGKLLFSGGSVLRLNGIGSTPPTNPINAMTYQYHIRGWLKGMNSDGSGNFMLGVNGIPAPLGFILNYEEGGHYNGNISSQRWYRENGGFNLRTYTYGYDKANRLTGAAYTNFAPGNTENFSVNNLTYDKNGNLTSMIRSSVDQLSYNYPGNSNKLQAVTDATSNTLGFSDVAGPTDYTYWPDGSLKSDANRRITDIQYNLLKLPRQITFSTGTVLTFQYDATGRKLKMTSTPTSGTATVRDYVGPFQYLDNTLFEIAHPEGRYSPANGYEFFHKDHLGNVRAVTSQTTTASGSLTAVLTQYTDYDPWGLPLWGGLSGGNSTNRMGFLNREFVAETGYQDLQNRLYDASIGRFTTVDPLSNEQDQESLSPFHYSYNNPIRFSDPNGLAGIGCCGPILTPVMAMRAISRYVSEANSRAAQTIYLQHKLTGQEPRALSKACRISERWCRKLF
jgi:RHS repeat-associated protein